MKADWSETGAKADASTPALRVDGGMSASDFTMQFLSDIINAPVERPHVLETTAMGAAWLAGHQAGLLPDMQAFADSWTAEARFDPTMAEEQREEKYIAWKRAVKATIGFAC